MATNSESSAAAFGGMFNYSSTQRRYTEIEFETLQANYVAEHGYSVVIPDIGSIFHLTPEQFRTKAGFDARKTRQFETILGSPSPEWVRSYASVMTWLDDIEDALTTGVVLSGMMVRLMPKLLMRFVPTLGWMLLAKDVFDIAIRIGRSPMSVMGGKRTFCHVTRHNPFNKKAIKHRAWSIRNLKPSLGSLLEILQTSDQFLGVGICLGSIAGFITDAVFGVGRFLQGQKVTLRREPPPLYPHERKALKGLKAATCLATCGQEMSEWDHFLAYYTLGVSSAILAPYFDLMNPFEIVENPMDILISANLKDDMSAFGKYFVDDVVYRFEPHLWPHNGQNVTTIGDLSDYMLDKVQNTFPDWCIRTNKSIHGYAAVAVMDQGIVSLVNAVGSGDDVEQEALPYVEMLVRLFKVPKLIHEATPESSLQAWADWVDSEYAFHSELPSVTEAVFAGVRLGVIWKDSYPKEPDPGAMPPFDNVTQLLEDVDRFYQAPIEY